MLIRPYSVKLGDYGNDNNNDYNNIKTLLKNRDMSEDLINDIPRFGLVAVRQGKVIAFGGLRLVEGNRGMLDSYITDPSASPEDRNRALDLITYKLIQIAKDNEIKQLISFSVEENIRLRAERHGFKPFKNAYLQLINV